MALFNKLAAKPLRQQSLGQPLGPSLHPQMHPSPNLHQPQPADPPAAVTDETKAQQPGPNTGTGTPSNPVVISGVTYNRPLVASGSGSPCCSQAHRKDHPLSKCRLKCNNSANGESHKGNMCAGRRRGNRRKASAKPVTPKGLTQKTYGTHWGEVRSLTPSPKLSPSPPEANSGGASTPS